MRFHRYLPRAGCVLQKTRGLMHLMLPVVWFFGRSEAQIFVANYGKGTVSEYTTSGTVVNDPVNNPLISGLDSPFGITVFGGHLFVGNLSSGTIGEYTISGATINSNLISGLQSPMGLVVDGQGNLYAANYAAGTVGKYTTSGSTVNSSLVSGLNGPSGLALDGKGTYSL